MAGKIHQAGKAYEVCMANMQTPLVHSKQTGKWFTLSFPEIVEMAVEAGIDK